jgi:hypothetical protein
VPTWYALATLPAALAWSSGAWAAPAGPVLLYTVWSGIGLAAYWFDMAMYWGLRSA